jgi:hypothetical protein
MIVARCFEIVQERQNRGCIQICNGQIAGCAAGPLLHECKEQPESVAVHSHRPRTDLFVFAEVLGEEGLNERGKLSWLGH